MEMAPEITMDELEIARRRSRYRRAVGPDGISAVVLKTTKKLAQKRC